MYYNHILDIENLQLHYMDCDSFVLSFRYSKYYSTTYKNLEENISILVI